MNSSYRNDLFRGNNSAISGHAGRRNEEEQEEEEDKAEKQSEAMDPLSHKFLKTRQILLSGEINKPLAEKIIRQLLVLEADSEDPIKIFIDSPGGDADAGFAIFDMIRFIKAPVFTIGMGLVASGFDHPSCRSR